MLFHYNYLRPILSDTSTVCFRCRCRLSKRRNELTRRVFHTSPSSKQTVAVKVPPFHKEYFITNCVLGLPTTRSQLNHEGVLSLSRDRSVSSPIASSVQPKLAEGVTSTTRLLQFPHRRKKRLKDGFAPSAGQEPLISPDASSQLSSLSSSLPAASLRRLLTTCLSLSKPRLSFLMVLTTAAAYSLYPVPTILLPSSTALPSLSTLTLVFLTTGTALCSASANALNMLLEPEHDAKMSRTRNRPIVRGLIGKRGALVFAGITAFIGTGCLWYGVNPTVAFLGALNIGLYAGIYTPLKRISVLNTWVGALVGGIPPLMGWAAAAGQSATGNGDWKELLFSELSIGGWLLAGLLYAWQFPHFNGLSWNIREEYRTAGYRMLAWVNPRMNGRVALRYAILLFPICAGLWWFQITDQGFLVTSSVVNGWIVREGWRFWRKEGQRGSARGLFWASVWHLPVVMVLAMAHKKGLWEGVWRWFGSDDSVDGPLDNEEEADIEDEQRGKRKDLLYKVKSVVI